ncbi:hypothetical protein N752_29850 [Desulforamulus aquiferis]|nr:hypothetical protein [Desulforamulus aquiferis]RYD01507.1 hypothetical protein N752_29850 [Desulforamulus aquiferis]
MEKIQSGKAITREGTNETDYLMETYDVIDRFLEQKLFKFVCLAVPIYMVAHIINYLLNK